MSGRGSTGAGATAGAAGGSAARRAWVSRAARARDWRSASAQRDAAVASWTIASGKRLRAERDSAPLNTVSARASSAGVAPASIARFIALSARARSDRTTLSSRTATGGCAADSAPAAGEGAGTRARDGGLGRREGRGTGAPRPAAVSVGTAGGGGADTVGVCHARQGANHQSAAAIATPPTPPTPHQRREPRRARGTTAVAGRVCGFESTSGLVGVLTWAIKAEPAPAFARVTNSQRTGSSGRSGARPHTATKSSVTAQ